MAGADLVQVRVDEQRDTDASGGEPAARVGDCGLLSRDVEPAFGRHFSPLLRHEAHVLGLHLKCDGEHLPGRRDLEIHARLQCAAHGAHVAVLDVPAILAQVQRDRIGAPLLGDQRGKQRVRRTAAARLAQRRHVVDVDVEPDQG